jgi:predicted permease
MAILASESALLDSLLEDFRYALRTLRKNRPFALVCILTLALGIGSTTAIFSVIDCALFNPYPYKNAQRLATPVSFSADQQRAWRFPAAAFVDFKQQNHTFEDMFGLVYRSVRLTRGDATEVFSGGWVTPGTFESLGMRPRYGRALAWEDARPEAPPVFVISYRLWTSRFNRDPKIVGTTQTLNSTRMTLVGVMPPRFQFGDCDLWLPVNISRDTFLPGGGPEPNEVWAVGHLKPGVSSQTAAADLELIASRIQNEYPIYFPSPLKLVVNTFASDPVNRVFKFALFALMAAVILLLFIACSNIANLLLARATTREREFGIRSALGASRARLIRQLLVESFSLALASCALGCLFAYLGLKTLVALIPAGSLPPEAAIVLSPAALLFCLGATALTTLLCGLAPGLHSIRSDSQLPLTGSGKGLSTEFRHGNLRSSLVIAEVAISIVLSICSGLIMRSLFALQNVSIGFTPSKVVYADISWPEGQYDSAQQKHFLLRKVLDRVSQFPGFIAATETSSHPPYTWGWTTVAILGKRTPTNRNTASIFCTEGYFQTLARPLLRGALFSQNDIDSLRRVVLVNQTFVRDRFGMDDPIGHQVRFIDFETLPDWPHDPYFQIIGVVGDAKNSGLQDPPRPEVYLPATLTGAGPRSIMVSTAAYAPTILDRIRGEVSSVDPNVSVGDAGTIEAFLRKTYFARPRFLLLTFSTYAVIALLLVAVGIFSVVSYTVALQTHEFGIRMALGAQPTDILSLVLGRGMRLVLAGVFLGLFSSYLLTRLLASQVWGVSTTDPPTFAGVAALALLVSALACLLPARRASRIDPVIALRYE